MEGDLVTEPPSDKGSRVKSGSAPLRSYSEVFVRQFPFYLALGMTYDQYWNEDCMLVKYYREAYEFHRKERNYELWLQGLYFYHALCDAAPLFRVSTKAQRASPYLEEPFPTSEKEVKAKKESEERLKYDKMRAKMEAMVKKSKQKKEAV